MIRLLVALLFAAVPLAVLAQQETPPASALAAPDTTPPAAAPCDPTSAGCTAGQQPQVTDRPPPLDHPLADSQEAADRRSARNTLYVELGGSTPVYSVNWELFLTDNAAIRVGFSTYAWRTAPGHATSYSSISAFATPATISYLGLRSRSHVFELGAGAVLVPSEQGGLVRGAMGTAIVGYRYAPLAGGFNFRVAFTPVSQEGVFIPSAGILAGYGF